MWVYNNFELIEKNFQSLIDFCNKNENLSIDTETRGMNPKHGELLMVQIGNLYEAYILKRQEFEDNLSFFKTILSNKLNIYHNAQFDLRWLYHYDIFPKRVYDTFLAEVILTSSFNFENTPNTSVSLKEIVKKYCGEELDKSIRGDIHKGITDEVLIYAAKDVLYLEECMNLQLTELKKFDLIDTAKFEFEFVKALAWRAYNGIPIDSKGWLNNNIKNKEQIKTFEVKLDNLVIDKNSNYKKYSYYTKPKSKGKSLKLVTNYNLDLFNTTPDRFTSINWNSHIEVGKLLKKEYNINFKDKDKKETLNINVIKLSKRNIKDEKLIEFLDLYIEYKEKQKEVSTYGESFIKNYVKNEYVYPQTWQIQDTGRQSMKEPNSQNIPSDYRKFFIAPEGYKFITADFSSQEPRITANKTNDPVLLDFIQNGDGDLHNLVSTIISSFFLKEELKVNKKNNPYIKSIGKNLRDIGKAINLGLDYGKTAYSLAIELNCSKEIAQKLIDLVNNRFIIKTNYLNRITGKFIKDGYITIETVLRRKIFLPDIEYYREAYYNRVNSKELGQIMRACRNYPTQGTAASMTKYAEILAFERLDKEKAYICNSVHDELDAIAREDYAEEAALIIKEAMLEAGKKFCSRVPMKVEPLIGDYWLKD